MFDQEDDLTIGWALKQFGYGLLLGLALIVPLFIASAASGWVQ